MIKRLFVIGLCLLLSGALEATTTFMEPGTDATQDATTFYGSITGAVTSDSTIKHTGPRSIKMDTGATPLTCQAKAIGSLADTGRRMSVYFYTDTTPDSSGSIMSFYKTASSTVVFQINLGADLILSIIAPGVTTVAGTTVLSTDKWYRLSVAYYVTNTTTFAIRLYIDGRLEASMNPGTLTNTASADLALRNSSLTGSNKITYFDDLYVDDGASSSSQPDTGVIYVTAKRPNANGTTNDFSTQIGIGGSGYGSGHSPQVNEQPLSATNGWSMVGAGSAVTEEYNVENTGTGDVNISNFSIVDTAGWVFASTLSAETGQIILNGATSNIALTTTNTLFKKFAGSNAYPSGTGADVGIITDTTLTTVSLYEAGVFVAYYPFIPCGPPFCGVIGN